MLSAIGLILHQKEATIYLVESGLTSWQFGRILTFLLPGFIIIPATLLGLNLKGKQFFLGMIAIVLLIFSFDLLNYAGFEKNEIINKHPLINAFDGSAMWTGSHVYLLILMMICTGIQWGIKNEQKSAPIFVYLLFIPLFAVSLLDFPIYDTDFSTHEDELPEGISHDYFNVLLPEPLPEDYVIFAFNPGCGICEQAAQLVGATVRGHKTIPMYMVFSTQQSEIDQFIEFTACEIPYYNLPKIQDFLNISNRQFPKTYLVKNKKIVSIRNGVFLNYQFLDQLIK